MPVQRILLLRHAHRLSWSLNPTTGEYTSSLPFPTRLPADPPLASHGVSQSEEVAVYLVSHLSELVQSDRVRWVSSPFYRCLQTLAPTVRGLNKRVGEGKVRVKVERGVGEWFGAAPFVQPVPAEAMRLRDEFFEFVDGESTSLVVPGRKGERIEELHARVGTAFEEVVREVDEEFSKAGRGGEEVTLVVCSHAAAIIAAGRVLTGEMPIDESGEVEWDREDFKCFTAGLSVYERKGKEGKKGDWTCTSNSVCDYLSGGEERGWRFQGDESFDSYGAGTGKSEVVPDASEGSAKL